MKIMFILVYSSVYEAMARRFEKAMNLSGRRIIGGSAAERYEFPYQISYQFHKRHYCGGSILSKKWVLTAAQCINPRWDDGMMRVVAGMLQLGENHTDVQVSGIRQVIVHPNVVRNDIALLHLWAPFQWTKAVKPIRLPRRNARAKGTALLSGWGRLSSNFPVNPMSLQKVQVQITSYKECKKLTPEDFPIEKLICLKSNNTGICLGDSGGPLMVRGKLFGVASWQVEPCLPPFLFIPQLVNISRGLEKTYQ